MLTLSSCAVAHPLLEELLVDGDFGSATGSDPPRRNCNRGANRCRYSISIWRPSSFRRSRHRCGRTEVRTSSLDSRRSCGSCLANLGGIVFTRLCPDGAEALVNVVAQMAAEILEDSTRDQPTLVDAYCGVGLLPAASARWARGVARCGQLSEAVIGGRRKGESAGPRCPGGRDLTERFRVPGRSRYRRSISSRSWSEGREGAGCCRGRLDSPWELGDPPPPAATSPCSPPRVTSPSRQSWSTCSRTLTMSKW